MRHYVLTLILSAFFLTSNGQEIIGDPTGGGVPRKPVNVALNSRSGNAHYQTIEINKGVFYIPVNIYINADQNLYYNAFPHGLTPEIHVEFFDGIQLITTITYNPKKPLLLVKNSENSCNLCEPSNYDQYKLESIIPISIQSNNILQHMSCPELNALTLVVTASIVTGDPIYPNSLIHPYDYSRCELDQYVIWPSDCYEMIHLDRAENLMFDCKNTNFGNSDPSIQRDRIPFDILGRTRIYK